MPPKKLPELVYIRVLLNFFKMPVVSKFKVALEPIFEMLEYKEKILSKSDWNSLVNATKDRIVNAPDQYLAGIWKIIGRIKNDRRKDLRRTPELNQKKANEKER